MSLQTIQKGTLEYSISENLAVPHCFTTRLGGVSDGIFRSLNMAMHRGDPAENVIQNYRILGSALGFDPKNVVMTRQTHSCIVRAVTKDDCLGLDHRAYPECDGLVTNDPGVALVIFTADCTPILLHDPVTGAVGAAHAGWRGTASAIAAKTVQAMATHFGADPANIRAAIGPNIGPCCFRTDADVPKAMLDAFGDEVKPFIRLQGEKFHVDLKGINALILHRAGVKHIGVSSECTMCRPDRFWSHRVTGPRRGSQGAVIVRKEEP